MGRAKMMATVDYKIKACRPVVDGTDVDPKVQVILHYLREQNWLEQNGVIIFSQYRTTAEWVLEALCMAFPNERVLCSARGRQTNRIARANQGSNPAR